ncbi:UDP-glucose:glycoprotein glucosyltransferase-domain-containing protein [Lipomyces chichibuensis]|uniref:UDP-glucose:glycoprotein glucosyltransferase-domain-containing protein n=1 Tax=Lipomyces chichibuensis TaxID=1546026 RepID=UPI0033442543
MFRPSTSVFCMVRCMLLWVVLVVVSVAATPSVHIKLDLPWTERSPYLLELVEAFAEEVPESYFPLLTHLVEFSHEKLESYDPSTTLDVNILTHQLLYDEAIAFSQASGYIPKLGGTRDWINMRLTLRTAASRIQAYYQYYNASVCPQFTDLLSDCGNDSWFWYDNQVSCDPGAVFALKTPLTIKETEILPFDRELSTNKDAPVAILYADVTSPKFLAFHSSFVAEADKGKLRYILRYIPSDEGSSIRFPERSRGLTGYGVELAMKRTDYVVIDDRDKDSNYSSDSGNDAKAGESAVVDDLLSTPDMKDVIPLSRIELADISLKAAGFILQQADGASPMDVLLRLSEDFPKHAAAIVAMDFDNLGAIQEEMAKNLQTITRMVRFSHGDNSIFVNGARVDSVLSDNPISILDVLNRERKLIDDLNYLELSNKIATELISGPAVLKLKDQSTEPRFDCSDKIEGGDTIVWLNNIEKDAKYRKMSTKITAILEPHYPGQFHQIRKNIHSVVIPVDLNSLNDLFVISKQIRPLIQRGITVRFGLVPLVETERQRQQATIFYYLYINYSLQAAMAYLEESMNNEGEPSTDSFDLVRNHYKPKKDAPSLVESPNEKTFITQVGNAAAWAKRLDISVAKPIVFGNGYVVPKDDNSWLQSIASKLDSDIELIRTLVEANIVTDNTDIQAFLLETASARRNKLIFPDDPGLEEHLDLVSLYKSHSFILKSLPTIEYKAPSSGKLEEEADAVGGTAVKVPIDISVLVAADLDSEVGISQFQEIMKLLATGDLPDNIRVKFMHNPGFEKNAPKLSTLLNYLSESGVLSKISPKELYELTKDITPTEDFKKLPGIQKLFQLQSDAKTEGWAVPDNAAAFQFWESAKPLMRSLGLSTGEGTILVNSRAIRLSPSAHLDSFDLTSLLKYESTSRTYLAVQAAREIGILDTLSPSSDMYDFSALLSSVLVKSDDLDISGGFYQMTSKRNSRITDYSHEYCGFDVGGDFDNAALKIVAILNPTGEFTQKYAPILKTLSEIDGVVVRVYLNPTLTVEEMPIKRFYRSAINSTPTFAANGSLMEPETIFEGVPSDVLLTLGMDVPSAWLVTPYVSKYDLDNIILSSVSESKLEAEYLLKNILVQGHVRDVSRAGGPPAGLQLTLGSAINPQLMDTIVMANLGYMQFKSEPGVWKLGLKSGRSQEIFHLDSAGAHGFTPSVGDINNINVYVTKFTGVTIFPRVSRNPGQETASVYGDYEGAEDDGIVNRLQKSVQQVLAGFLKVSPVKKTELTDTKQAAINIFSVASGHLYERFLNIMFVSVMTHTNETVKFWLIENFLSPSFKEFLPYMAKEYGFDYELITYKWPHWLRAQKEKQRIIWGYKILFLDVMFPLDLDKVIFVDADQIVRTDMKELVDLDLHGAPYGYTPMCDSRTEMEGFRFWKQGYWKSFLGDNPYHISALYVVDLKRFRQMAAGDKLRQQYHQLSADPLSLSNLDQDLPNNMQRHIPIFSLPQDWLWCETWCSDEALKTAKTIDLCNNPMTKEPKLDRARRQVPEWTVYDNEITSLAKRVKSGKEVVGGANAAVNATEVRTQQPVAADQSVPPRDEL